MWCALVAFKKRCRTQPGTAVAATFVAKAEPTNADAESNVPVTEFPFIRTAYFRELARKRDNKLGTTLSITATATMGSARPGHARLNPAALLALTIIDW